MKLAEVPSPPLSGGFGGQLQHVCVLSQPGAEGKADELGKEMGARSILLMALFPRS